jgi:hypothetical protein
MTLDCGDNSCAFAKSITGMRTNGGCRCLEALDHDTRRAVRLLVQELRGDLKRMTSLYERACNGVKS